MTSTRKNVPWFLWPFAVLWDFLAFVLGLTGRLVAALLGVLIMAAGVTLTLTVVGSPVGIPLIVLGFLLLLRSLF